MKKLTSNVLINSKNPIDKIKNKKIPSQGNISSIILIALIFAASFTSDKFIYKSVLSIPLIASTILSALITGWGVPRLRGLKVSQIIRKEGPVTHQKKGGTPTMGGLLVVPIGLLVGNLMSINNHIVLALSFLILTFMLIGFIDDWSSLNNNTNKGLTPKAKLILQSFASTIFLYWAYWQNHLSSSILLPFGIYINLNIFIWPVALFIILAESNSTNLTDGLDGLASGCGSLVFTGLAIQLILRGNPELASFCMAMAGAWLGFLMHNRKPAKIFMGDTGSLAMGGALSGIALLSNSLWPLLIMGGVFLVEALSVILQVSIYKVTKKINGTGKRIFLMAPLHHHFEIAGKNEEAIVRNFWSVTLGLVLLGVLLRPIS